MKILTKFPEIVKKRAFCQTCLQMGVISAPLGMMLDNQHGLFGVLTYNSLKLTVEPWLHSAWWVPPTFGAAGVVMSAIVLTLDEALGTEISRRDPTWPRVWYSISLFSAQYWLSGAMDSVGASMPIIHVTLAILAGCGFAILDGSTAGFILGIATAISGPIVEILLIKTGLYYYTNADVLGICSWIPWVYLLGEIGVGNLARRLYVENDRLEETEMDMK
jgi:hypothetical protein